MIGSRAWRALMWRNVVYRKRNWIGTLFEFALPVAFVGILVAIKSSVQNSSSFAPTVIPASFPNNYDAYVTLSFSDYVTALQAPRVCYFTGDYKDGNQPYYEITGLQAHSFNWQVPFVKCDSRNCQQNLEDAQKYCQYQILALAPANSSDPGGYQRAVDFQNYILERYPILANSSALPFDYSMIKIFSSNQDIDNYVQAKEYGDIGYPKIAMGVIFSGNDPSNYAYTLRLNSTNFNAPEEEAQPAVATTPNTKTLFSSYARDDSACPPNGGGPYLGPLSNSCTGQYMYNGVLIIQRLVHDFIFVRSGAKDNGYYVAEHGVVYVPFPSPQYVKDGFYAQIGAFSPLLVTLGLLYPVAAIIRAIVLEKESRQKELMKMMSVTESDIGWSWFLSFWIFHIVTATVTAIVTTQLYSNSAPFFLWLFWMFTFLAIICFCFALSTITSKSTRATLIGLLVFFVGYFLTVAVSFDTGSGAAIGIISLHPVAAFSYGLQQIGFLEDKGIGVTANSFKSTDNSSGYTFQTTLSSLIVDTILWGLVYWYLNRVIPQDYGQPSPFYFPFTRGYWCPGWTHAPAHPELDNEDEVLYDESIPVEPVSDTLKAQTREGKSIEIRGLSKRFGEKVAVEGLNLSMYNGQVTGLLGHNGAGKTTTINMLTGMIAPTEGYATISGKDIRTQMPQIRQEIGVCLQHDCLFPQLTVKEHIQFFAMVKGMYARMNRREAEAKIATSIQDVALSEKSNTLSKNLSGGMKRKLSVAIAFCGDSSTILLDEPTSGMDPFSRRFTWNVIRQYRQGRTIILTTHFMDEADILSDTIAIMADGTLRCVGSSLFLKKTYGVGYQLTIEKSVRERRFALTEDTSSTGMVELDNPQGDAYSLVGKQGEIDASLCDIVTSAVREAHVLSNVGTELSFQLPIGASSQFTPMFEALDQEIERGTIETYGVSITTLDEVFLLVARGAHGSTSKMNLASSRKSITQSGNVVSDKEDDGEDKDITVSRKELKSSESGLSDENSVRSRMDLAKSRLFGTHLRALFRKRAINFKRDKKAWVCTTVLPSVFVLIGFLLFAFVAPDRNLVSLQLTLNDYNEDVTASPRNPIPFNAPGDIYTCQPGYCSYQDSVVSSPFPNDTFTYAYCGVPASLQSPLNLNGGPSCTVNQSQSLVDAINVAGATPIDAVAGNVTQSSKSIFNTSTSYAATQYGAIFYTHDRNSITVVNGTYNKNTTYANLTVQTCLNNSANFELFQSSECPNYAGIGYLLSYNFTALHVTPLYQTLADQAILQEGLGNNGVVISATIHPLPITKVEKSLGEAQDAFLAWFLVVLSFPFIAGSFATFVVMERESKAKHLQTVAGVNPSAYWLATYFWDIMNYQIPMWITVILMFAFDVNVLVTTTRHVVSGVIVTLILYGPASAGFTYCLSFLFRSPSMCNLFVIIFGFLIGMGGPLTQFILRLIGSDPSSPKQNLVNAANILQWVLRFIPSFCLGNGIFNAINIETYEWLEGSKITVWDNDVLLFENIFLFWESFAYIALAMQLDRWSSNPRAVSMWRKFVDCITCRCSPRKGRADDLALAIPDDDDVVREQERVLSGEANDDLIVISQFTKVYDTGKVAVNNLSLGIPPGQCFGLLGINGAGKTTTMAMLTAEFPPTSGDATLAGFSVRNQPEKTRRRIGYCPQFDAHFMNLTGREHVELYASIKGVPASFVKEAAATKLKEVGLSDFDSDRLSAGYSGGMKRRLSLACATIGQPQIVFLDECSTGVDPVARREIWQMISDMVSGGNIPENERTSVILTTHSMEECEALCPRIGIMANGKLRCLGSAQHLKTKFGQGFQVELKVKNVDRHDEDFRSTYAQLLRSIRGVGDVESLDTEDGAEFFAHLEQVQTVLASLTGDDYLTQMVSADDPNGYIVFKNASSAVGVALDELAVFATAELRIRNLNNYVMEAYPNSILRERQDNKVRYEVGSNYRISGIFASIEENKDRLLLADYGVSQTSLEQVFNMHAAEAEKLKFGGQAE